MLQAIVKSMPYTYRSCNFVTFFRCGNSGGRTCPGFRLSQHGRQWQRVRRRCRHCPSKPSSSFSAAATAAAAHIFVQVRRRPQLLRDRSQCHIQLSLQLPVHAPKLNYNCSFCILRFPLPQRISPSLIPCHLQPSVQPDVGRLCAISSPSQTRSRLRHTARARWHRRQLQHEHPQLPQRS